MQPKSCQPAYLEVCDIAGLVKGAAEVGGRCGAGGRAAGAAAALCQRDNAACSCPPRCSCSQYRLTCTQPPRQPLPSASSHPPPHPPAHSLPPAACRSPVTACRLQGQGLGNSFLSHISAVDGIFHICRAFDDADVVHVEDRVDPVEGAFLGAAPAVHAVHAAHAMLPLQQMLAALLPLAGTAPSSLIPRHHITSHHTRAAGQEL